MYIRRKGRVNKYALGESKSQRMSSSAPSEKEKSYFMQFTELPSGE